jgi:hypothetical protein
VKPQNGTEAHRYMSTIGGFTGGMDARMLTSQETERELLRGALFLVLLPITLLVWLTIPLYRLSRTYGNTGLEHPFSNR